MIPTPHIAAEKEDIAKVVLMPGDPMRSKWIAENFLENSRLVNNIRGVQGYTGSWHGKPVTVMASGVGIPSISVYAYELFNFYDIDLIIRTGTIGSIQPDVNVHDVIVAETAFTNSGFLDQFKLPADYIPTADGKVTEKVCNAAKQVIERDALGNKYHAGSVLTQEIYYSMEEGIVERWAEKGILGFEMEAAALFANAAQSGKKAAALFTVSNKILTGEEMDPLLREKSLNQMIEIALKAALEQE